MKTTLNLPDALLDAVKQRASQEGRTQTSVVEEALRRMLREDGATTPYRPMPVFGEAEGNALLVDLEDRDALYAALEAPTQSRAAA